MYKNKSYLLISSSLVVLLYVALITFQPSLQLWPKNIIWFIDRQRILELLLLSLTLANASLIGFTKKKTIPINKFIRLAFLLLLILSCFSVSLAHAPRHALIEVSVFAALIYFALFVATLYQEDKNLFIKRLSYIIWASILLYLLSFYTGYITATVVKKPLNWPFPFTGFSNIRSFNQYQLWSLGFIVLPLIYFELNRNTRFLLQVALTAWWVLLFYSASRGVLIAWSVAMCLTALTYKSAAWPFLKLQLTHITTGFLTYQLLFKIIPTANQSTIITQSVTRSTTNDRVALWEQAITMISNFPIFGAGPMHFAWFNKTNGHPHNSILQLASEWGLPATLVVLIVTSYGLYHWFKKFNVKTLQANSLNMYLTIILFFTIIANGAYSMVDGVIVTPISQVLMFTIIGLMIGQYTSESATISPQPKLRPILASLLLLTLALSTYPEIKQGFSGNSKGFSMGHTAIGPRFWRETK